MSNKCLNFCFSFTKNDDLLMRLHSLYRRSPKKGRELKDIGEALEELVVKPARSQGRDETITGVMINRDKIRFWDKIPDS